MLGEIRKHRDRCVAAVAHDDDDEEEEEETEAGVGTSPGAPGVSQTRMNSWQRWRREGSDTVTWKTVEGVISPKEPGVKPACECAHAHLLLLAAVST